MHCGVMMAEEKDNNRLEFRGNLHEIVRIITLMSRCRIRLLFMLSSVRSAEPELGLAHTSVYGATCLHVVGRKG